MGPANGIIVFGYRLLPGLYDRLVGPVARIAVFSRDTCSRPRATCSFPCGRTGPTTMPKPRITDVHVEAAVSDFATG
jgi:hypothetical protein